MYAVHRPFSIQGLVDMLAQYGCKKAQITRAVDTFVESKELLCKACLQLDRN